MEDYDDNPRYEKLDEGVYYDTETEETVFPVSDEQRRLMRNLWSNIDEDD